MSKEYIDISESTLFGKTLKLLHTNKILSDEDFEAFQNKAHPVAESDVKLIKSEIIFDNDFSPISLNDIMIALTVAIKIVSEDLKKKEKEIDQLVESKVQDKISNEYVDIFNEINEIHHLIHANKEKIKNMHNSNAEEGEQSGEEYNETK